MKFSTLYMVAVLGAAALAFPSQLDAQVTSVAESGPDGLSGGGLSLAALEAAQAAMEQDETLDSTAKDLLRPNYEQAIAILKRALDYKAKSTAFARAVESAPIEATMARASKKKLVDTPVVSENVMVGTAADYQKQADQMRVDLAGLKRELATNETNLALVRNRPGVISTRLPAARHELATINSSLEGDSLPEQDLTPGRIADRILLQVKKQALENELEMLVQEQLSQAVRQDLLIAKGELLSLWVERSSLAFELLGKSINQRLAKEAKRVVLEADAKPSDIDAGDKGAQALTVEVRDLAREFERVVGRLTVASSEEKQLADKMDDLNGSYGTIREQLDLGGGGVAMARILFDLRGGLPGIHELDVKLKGWKKSLDTLYLDAFNVDGKIRKQSKLEKEFSSHPSEGVAELLAIRKEILTRLRRQYGNLIAVEAGLLGDGREFQNKVIEVRAFLEEKLFWARSSPPFDAKSLAAVPAGLVWLNHPDQWLDLGTSLVEVAKEMHVVTGLWILMVLVLLLMRRRIKKLVKESGVQTRRISSDRYVLTLGALAGSVLLALPLSLLLAGAGWALGEVPSPSSWLRGISQGLRFAGWAALFLGFVSAVCRRDGLGDAHFGWPKPSLALMMLSTRWLLIGYVPMLVITASSLYGDAAQYFDGAGRASFMAAHLILAYVYWRLLRFSTGIFSSGIRDHPSQFPVQVRYIWFPLALGFPLSLVVLAGMGYMFTAMELGVGLISASAVIFTGVVLYWVVLRWFIVKERKIALTEALNRRRARQEAADSDAQEGEPGETIALEPVDEKLALRSISQQTRYLLQFLFSMAVLLVIMGLWSRFMPVFSVLGAVYVAGGLTLLALGKAVLIVFFTVIAGRNLPGFLELAVLRATTLDLGTRSAVATLFQYLVYAVGLASLFGVLELDWSKFGWIAAALSVGLGFGLQEVVANFVCGLILLFECPIRVGDVVTVEGMTGTVTRIRMRATTIMNWDRQEFVIPNKNIITGTFLNWTLSNQINRIIITVGVAYGSDTEMAREILIRVANESSLVVDDPAPVATFEEFADSSLTLRLRACLPNIENRIFAISELSTAIDKQFKAAGIEISFPQRDLHIRSGADWGPSSKSKENPES